MVDGVIVNVRGIETVPRVAVIVTFVVASDDTEQRGLTNPNKPRVEEPPSIGSVNGKYRVLLRKIHVPQDEQSYGKFSDFGMYTGNSYVGINDLPPGYWVYVHPHWYIWRDCVKPDYVDPRQKKQEELQLKQLILTK